MECQYGSEEFLEHQSGGAFRSSKLDQTILRGGPMMMTPGNAYARLGLTSDNRQKFVFNASVNGTAGGDNSSDIFNFSFGISFKPTNWLVVSFNPGYSKSYSELQYVTATTVKNEDRYIFASIDCKTINASFRVNLNLSPNLTLQYWGQPFFATGKYYNYKCITDPMAADYRNRFHQYSTDQISLEGDTYNIDENNNGSADYSFGKPDFNIQQFLSNLVVRWEYNPGSSVYLVWSQTRNSSQSSSNLDLFNDFGNLFNCADNRPHNVFLIKFSYRFGLK